ncbi:MAG: KTSC domain-containing protein [Gammaproteobacteria bacterium]
MRTLDIRRMIDDGEIHMVLTGSSNLHKVGYLADQKLLVVQFRQKTAMYAYHGVEPKLYDRLMGAQSMGAFFSGNIRHRPFVKLPETVKEPEPELAATA